MWTAENRPRYNRDKPRYPSDLTGEEWAHIEPLIPPAKRGGGKRRVNMREVVNAVMCIPSTGCQWRYLPKDLPPKSTVHDYSARGPGMARWIASIHALDVKCREKAEREASPTARIIAWLNRRRPRFPQARWRSALKAGHSSVTEQRPAA